MPTPEQRAYARKLDEIIKRALGVEDATIKAMVLSLQDLRQRIAAGLLTAVGFEAYHLKELQANVDRLILEFAAQMGATTRAALGDVYRLGAQAAIDPLHAGGVQTGFHQFSALQLNAVMDFSADLIQNIGADMRARINTQLRLAVLGQRSPFQAMQNITEVLGVKATDLRWGRLRRPQVVRGVAARAEAILRTEMTRVYNMGHYSQQLETAQTLPDVRKGWMATGDSRTRMSHLIAHIEYFDDPIPVDEAFLVGGSQLMYPGDPMGSAAETINCRCRSYSVHVEIGQVATPVDSKVRAEAQARREATKAA